MYLPTSLVNNYIWIMNLELARGRLWPFLGITWTWPMPSFSMRHQFRQCPFQPCHPWWARGTVPRGVGGVFFLDYNRPSLILSVKLTEALKGAREELWCSRRMIKNAVTVWWPDFSAFSYKLQVFKSLPLAILLLQYFSFSTYFSITFMQK